MIVRFPLFQKTRYIVFFLVVFQFIGLVGISLPDTRSAFTGLTPLNLLVSCAFLFIFHKNHNKNLLLYTIVIFIFGFLLEVAGVKTAAIFGSYSYGSTLGYKIWDVPLLIGLNWVMLIYCAMSVSELTNLPGQFKILLSAIIMVIYDIALEPVAPRMHMWYWAEGSAPLQNYSAWFIASLIFVTIGRMLQVNVSNKIAPVILLNQFVFFLLLNITLRVFIV